MHRNLIDFTIWKNKSRCVYNNLQDFRKIVEYHKILMCSLWIHVSYHFVVAILSILKRKSIKQIACEVRMSVYSVQILIHIPAISHISIFYMKRYNLST